MIHLRTLPALPWRTTQKSARPLTALATGRVATAGALVFVLTATCAAADLTYLQGLLDATPAGGWVNANTNLYSDAWTTGASQLPGTSYTNPSRVVSAWSSFAWDSQAGNLILWGGGHANYYGNEVYLWQGSNGEWTRGSVPSRVQQVDSTSTWLIADGAAPQSSHTYDNNLYLPLNNMFLTFGGAAFNTGSVFQNSNGIGGVQRSGPWLFDPLKANADLVGGTSGSGYDPAVAGSQMWLNRQGSWVGSEPSNYVNASTAYRQENGHDVVYATASANGSSNQMLYRYEIGDIRGGGTDLWQQVGIAWYGAPGTGVAAIDHNSNLFVRTSVMAGGADLRVWDLSNNNAINPSANKETLVSLFFDNGDPFSISVNYGMDYSSTLDAFFLWDGTAQGKVYVTSAETLANGAIDTSWVVHELASTTSSQPSGSFQTGVLGKWQYIDELNAFIALNEYSGATLDAEVWLYKPLSELAPIPEPPTNAMLLAGLGVLLLLTRRRSRFMMS